MSYGLSSAGSTVYNPPVQVVRPIGGVNQASTVPFGQGIWTYSSTETTTAAFGANFFTDGLYLGMKPGDIVFCAMQTSIGSSPVLMIGMVSTAVTTSGAALSTGSFISSTML